ncbi:hypothetical protein E2562_038135 [Oryza meyeriana var. granulata]|uniref:Uncharacterized protein n=1 Tax=Oryza meyeriana var. granulata TaxID=110450 RepID=A0A6G1DT86_9ORYZ|nr:hypothetical protein E2562_038135 [Oryza meyeriana var. granulata]
MSLQGEAIAIYGDMKCWWLFEALSPIDPSSSQGKKRKRGAVHAEIASGPGHLQSASPGEGRADVLAEQDSGASSLGRE